MYDIFNVYFPWLKTDKKIIDKEMIHIISNDYPFTNINYKQEESNHKIVLHKKIIPSLNSKTQLLKNVFLHRIIRNKK